MNDWTTATLWAAFQITLLATFGLALQSIARRLGPAAGAVVSIGTLIAVLMLTALAWVPLPATWSPASFAPTLASINHLESERDFGLAPEPNGQAPARAVTRLDHAPPTRAGLRASDFWKALVDEMGRAPGWTGDAPRRWPIVVVMIMACSAAAGFVRLLAGATAVRSYRRHSRPITDEAIKELARSLAAENGVRRSIELRQTSLVSTPATVGCFSPLVLLPESFRDWTRDELRVVMAHEIAHVARGDYLTGLVAQVTLAFHFYHPLLHWLVRRLRFDQELAADALGIRASGGHEAYLMTLARMALRQDELSVSWAARPFLPTQGTFMRRIEMLRDSRKPIHDSLPRAGRACLIGTVALATLVITTLRPMGLDPAQAQSPEEVQTSSSAAAGERAAAPLNELSLEHIAPDAIIVAAVSPARVLARPEAAALKQMVNQQFQAMLGFPVEQLEQLTLALFVDDQLRPDSHCLVLRSLAPRDWTTLAKHIPELETVEFAGQRYSRIKNDPEQRSLFAPDERTLIIQSELKLKEAIANRGRARSNHAVRALWSKLAQRDAVIAVTPIEGLGAHLGKSPPGGHLAMSLAPLWRDTRAMAMGVELAEGFDVSGYVDCKDADGAERVARTIEAVRTLFQNTEPEIRNSIVRQPAEMANATLPALNALSAIVESAKVTTNGHVVELTAEGPSELAATIGMLAAPIASAREAARRAQSTNNLKQIALAMFNYADANGSFPPATVIGPDGKTPHSWRVALLPYLEQESLYRQYKFDEPWDSASNRQVLANMPAIYRHPGDEGPATESSYFVLTGESTMFNGSTGCRLTDVTDGTSNTLLVVEANRSIPWTRPEDIPLDAVATARDLGGFHPQGFNAAFGDGSVRFIAGTIAPTVLRALATKAGSEAVDVNTPNQPEVARP